MKQNAANLKRLCDNTAYRCPVTGFDIIIKVSRFIFKYRTEIDLIKCVAFYADSYFGSQWLDWVCQPL
jgi:hypothetical protein